MCVSVCVCVHLVLRSMCLYMCAWGEQHCEVACGQEKVKAQEIGAGFGRYVVISDGGGGQEKYTGQTLTEHLPWLPWLLALHSSLISKMKYRQAKLQ